MKVVPQFFGFQLTIEDFYFISILNLLQIEFYKNNSHYTYNYVLFLFSFIHQTDSS